MVGYSGTPLAKKLGILEGSTVLLDGVPTEFSLDWMPPTVRLDKRPAAAAYDVILCFCPDLARLERRWPELHPRTSPAGALWIAWPKRSSGLATDLDGNVVREYVLAHGRVDVKVCAVDEVWSGLKNVIRRAER